MAGRRAALLLVVFLVLLATTVGRAAPAEADPVEPDPQPPTAPEGWGGWPIELTFIGEWDPAAQALLEAAADLWETVIYTPVPIKVEAEWHDWWYGPAVTDDRIYVGHDRQTPPYLVFYPMALHNALAGYDRDPEDAEFGLDFFRNWSWYLGADGRPERHQYDFMTLALRSIGVGLGLRTAAYVMYEDWGYIDNGFPNVYDIFVVNDLGQPITDFDHISLALGAQLKSGKLYFSGAHATAANGGARPKVYAPASWVWNEYQPPSLKLLLDEQAFPPGSPNGLMTAKINPGEVVHWLGPVAPAMLRDLGWPQPTHAHHVPRLATIPSQILLANTSLSHAVDLWDYASDDNWALSDLVFDIVAVSAPEAGVTLDGGRYVDINPQAGWAGAAQVMVRVRNKDTVDGLTGLQSFRVVVADQIYKNMLPATSRP